MNAKIKQYVNTIFLDIPKSSQSIKLREEILQRMDESFISYIREGKSENQAFSSAIHELGDIDVLLKDVLPTSDFKKEKRMYQKRNAKNIALSITLYILSIAALIASDIFLGQLAIGVLGMIVFIALATGILVYTKISTPQEFKKANYETDFDFDNFSFGSDKNSKIFLFYKSFKTTIWIIAIIIYAILTILTRAWHITWVILVLAFVIDKITQVILISKEDKN